MPQGGASSERVLILAPHGRDAEIASALLLEAGNPTYVCCDLEHLRLELEKGAAFVVVTEEAVAESDLSSLASWVKDQPSWSDMPIVLLTAHGESAGRVERATRYQDVLGNVTYLERPFHPTTLISVARSAIRSRRRQYEARASIERYVLLARELQHRTKNLLTVIQSIASASLPVGSARDEYFARLHALARAQDLLTEGDGRGASMGHLVEQALASFGQRAHIDGPQVFLGATTAQGFALVLHELATNAAKHGALTSPKGTLVVRWTLDSGPPAMLNFHWREQGGPAASPPKRKGFGTKLLEIAVAGGDMPPRFTYSSDRFEYEVSTPIDHAASEVP